MQKLNWTAIIISLVVVAAVISTVVYLFPRETNTVDSTGTAKMTVPPDKVVVYLQIETKATTAEEAKNNNADISSKVMTDLDTIGISKTDIETENYNIYQDCEWTQSGQKCKGFIANNNIKISSKDFTNVGKVVDAGVNAGALVSYINYELSTEKQNEYKKTVLSQAGQDAKSKAEAIAAGVGKKIGDLVSVSASDYNYIPYPLFARAESVGSADAKQVATNLPAKSLEVTATVSAKYELK